MILNLQLAIEDLVSIAIILRVDDQLYHGIRAHEVADLNYCAKYALCTESAIDLNFKDISMTVTVKARKKYGANSLDLTIPSAMCRELNIEAGDVFEVEFQVNNGKLLLTYLKVHKYH